MAYPGPRFIDQYETAGTAGAGLTVANGSSDYDCKTTGGLFAKVKRAQGFRIRSNVANITYKLNKTTNYSVLYLDADSWEGFDDVELTNIYISNATGSTATVYITLW